MTFKFDTIIDGEYNANSICNCIVLLIFEYLFENVNIKKRFIDGGLIFYTYNIWLSIESRNLP